MKWQFLILAAPYTTIIVSLIWARIYFFRVSNARSNLSSYFYDPAVAVQVLTTYYYVLYLALPDLPLVTLGLFLYVTSLVLFWWAIVTAKKLDFAFSPNVGEIITTGPFAIIRHPFYLSYVIVWSTSTLLFNSLLLWITLLYLIAFYSMSARAEEKVILGSEHSKKYSSYKNEVGMFLPRVKQWKSWLLILLKKKRR